MRTRTPEQAEKILAAATRLFGSHPFHEVRMEDIAAGAEVGKGTLYRYFADKEELYLAMLARSSDEFLRRMESAVVGPSPPRRRLEALVAGVMAHFDAEPHLLELIQRAEVLGARGGEFPWQRTRERLPRLLHQLFAEAAAQGDFRVHDPEVSVLMLLGGLRAVIRFGSVPRPADLPARLVARFLDGAADGPGQARGAAPATIAPPQPDPRPAVQP